jgi:hypothetical protein
MKSFLMSFSTLDRLGFGLHQTTAKLARGLIKLILIKPLSLVMREFT